MGSKNQNPPQSHREKTKFIVIERRTGFSAIIALG